MTLLPTSNMSDVQLVAATKRLVAAERATVAQVIVHLAEIELRRIHLAAGFPSLYAYCLQELQLSEHEALNRIEAARAGRAYPRILEMLSEGRLTLTTVQMLARKLTPENHERLLSEAAGRTKSQLLELLARHFPQPDVPAGVRRLPVPRPPAPGPSAPALDAVPRATPPPPAPPAHPRGAVAPLAPDRYKVTFTADGETRELLECAADMLSHAIPNGDAAAVIKRALKVLVDDLARRKFAATTRRASAGPANDQDLPAAVKHEVWVRDRGRCRFVGSSGHPCGSRRFIEFHHVLSRANGGKGTVANTELRCGPHNRYEADVESGTLIRRRLDPEATTRSGTSAPLFTTSAGPQPGPAPSALR
jgi:hypothetical protein